MRAGWDTVAEREIGLSQGGMEMTLHFRVEQMGGNDATDSTREARQKSRVQRKKTILLEVHTTLDGHTYFLSPPPFVVHPIDVSVPAAYVIDGFDNSFYPRGTTSSGRIF